MEIMWKVDWKFESIDKVLTDTCVSETKTVDELLSRFFDDTWKLGPTKHLFPASHSSAGAFDVFLVNFQKQEVPVNSKLSLREALRDQAILEYPTLIVRPRPEIFSVDVSPSV